MASDGDFKLYRYDPSIPLAAVASVLFAILTGLHFFQMYRSRVWFLIPLVLGGIFEVIGFAARAYNASQTPDWALGPYIIQSVLLLVAPALFAGSIYMILGRIILMTDGEKHSIVKRKWLTKLFVVGDVLSFMIQSGGAGLMASKSQSSVNTGEKIVVTGLIIQILFFGFFCVTAFVFHLRMRKVPTMRVSAEVLPWQKHLLALYISSTFIMVRSIMRVIEFVQGNTGYVFSHEWFLYVFDALLMLGVMGLFCWIHPAEIKGYLQRAKTDDTESGISGHPIQLLH